MHRLGGGRETVQRIVDARLAATLGGQPDLRKLRQHLIRAGERVVELAPRYEQIEVVPRAKRGLRRGEPRHLL